MFCPHCGKECENQMKFCPHCGKDTRSGQAVQAPEEPKPSVLPKTKPIKEKKPVDLSKVKKIWSKGVMITVIAFVLSVLIAGGSVGHFFLFPEALTGEKIPVQATADVAEPTYDEESIKKDKVEAKLTLGKPANDHQAEELAADMKKVNEAVTLGSGLAKDEYGELSEDNRTEYIYAVSSAMYDLYADNLIYDYRADSDYGVEVILHSGIRFIYNPAIEGYDAGAGQLLEVGTYQPYESDYSDSLSEYMAYPDESAELVSKTFPVYSFKDDDDRDDGEVTLDSLLDMANQSLVIWHGHGGYSYDVGSYLGTGVKVSEENDKKYYSLLTEGSLLKSSSVYLVTAKFFEKYLPDGSMDNSVVYLGACSSGRDSRLADAFLQKGAEAVYANDNTIRTVYNLSMIRSVVNSLCTEYDQGGYYTVYDALEQAKDENGSYDSRGKGAEVELFTENNGFSLDWYEDHMKADREVVLVLDTSGSMNGEPMEETKKAATKFVDTVVDNKAIVSLVSYNYSAETICEFSRRRTKLNNAIENLNAGGDTNVDAGLSEAYEKLKDSEAKKRIIIVMSDGVANTGRVGDELIEFADEIREDGIYIYSLGFFHSIYGSDLASAQKVMEGIADPGRHFEIDSAEDVAYVFDDLASQISGERTIYIRIACPVDVKITYKGETLSKKNTRTSFGSLSFEENEDGEDGDTTSTYYDEEENASDSKVDDRVKIVRLKEGVDYEVQIEGTDKGKMDYTIGFMDKNGEYTDMRSFENIRITKKTSIDTVAAYTTMTKLNVDEDGDGEYDFIYTAEVDSEAEKTEVVFPWQFTLAIIFGSIAAVSLALFVLCIVFLNKTKQKINLIAE